MQPTRESRRIDKKHGVAFPGSRSSMFLLYREPQSGIHVYFLEEAVGQNRDALVVRVPPAPIPEPNLKVDPPSPAENASRKAPNSAKRNDGYLSDELLDWYLKLQYARDALDLKDVKAVARFNEEAARYHAAVGKERREKSQWRR